ncbi:peptidoglycan-recognition protein SB2-like [Microplitis mediator]|uniref:peptidoglycan-recognition protein SB2-like n=1 Tax=Microplitis mediator TaxID=375433 RepID=UPI002554C70C|nr:peptidoglycan-recognition protein SB2-like [Microplitis mediator]
MFKLLLLNNIFFTIIIITIDGWIFHGDEFPNSLEDKINDSYEQLVFVNRTAWNALPTTEPIKQLDVIPAPFIMIYHTGTDTCFIRDTCSEIVRALQAKYFSNYIGDRDIGYNFLISGDGRIYIGRGWDTAGAHTISFNEISIGIALIGTFYDKSPTANQIFSLHNLIKLGIHNNHIAREYKYYSSPDMPLNVLAGTKFTIDF